MYSIKKRQLGFKNSTIEDLSKANIELSSKLNNSEAENKKLLIECNLIKNELTKEKEVSINAEKTNLNYEKILRDKDNEIQMIIMDNNNIREMNEEISKNNYNECERYKLEIDKLKRHVYCVNEQNTNVSRFYLYYLMF